jgi:hypothetical protein
VAWPCRTEGRGGELHACLRCSAAHDVTAYWFSFGEDMRLWLPETGDLQRLAYFERYCTTRVRRVRHILAPFFAAQRQSVTRVYIGHPANEHKQIMSIRRAEQGVASVVATPVPSLSAMRARAGAGRERSCTRYSSRREQEPANSWRWALAA